MLTSLRIDIPAFDENDTIETTPPPNLTPCSPTRSPEELAAKLALDAARNKCAPSHAFPSHPHHPNPPKDD